MRRLSIRIAHALVLAGAGVAAHAQMHMCKDAQGRKTYSDVPCGPDAAVVDVKPAAGSTGINPSLSTQVEHYEIRGTTYQALVRQIEVKGPEGWWGVARTRIGFALETRPTKRGCAVAAVQTAANARVRLPVWANRFEGPRNLQVYWDSLYRSLDLHERGHVQINVDGAKQLERALYEIPEQPTCEEIEVQAKRIGEAIWREVARRQTTYDADTEHGRRQWSPYRD